MNDLNDSLRHLHETLHVNPDVADVVRFSVVGFSDTVIEHLHMCDLRFLSEMPTLRPRGSTSYAAAFHDLRARIARDVDALNADGHLVTRPVVFFLSDGEPTDPDIVWRAALASLKDPGFKARPNVISVGFRDASPRVLVDVASNADLAFITAQGTTPAAALINFFTFLAESLTISSQAVAAGRTPPPFTTPEGFELAFDAV